MMGILSLVLTPMKHCPGWAFYNSGKLPANLSHANVSIPFRYLGKYTTV